MFPISDHNPTLRTPVTTYAIIAINVAVWVLVQGMGRDPALAKSVCELGLIPGEFLHILPNGFQIPLGQDMACVVSPGVSWYAPLTSMFLHGSWFHLIGNMWFLHVFGNNVEDVMGAARFVAFYLLCGLAAAGAHVAAAPASVVPTVGASGAISGVMGAYLLLFPRVRVRTFVTLPPIFFRVVVLPAWALLVWWFVIQLWLGLPQLARTGEPTGGVAVWAHVGGFVAGVLLVRAFTRPDLVEARRRMLLQRGLLQGVDGGT